MDMSFWSWLTSLFSDTEEEETPPEPLVLGAQLRCPYGYDDSFLIVWREDIDINSLPQACVSDCIANVNIRSFGICSMIMGPCENIMALAEQWENPEHQNVLANGKEIITTKSTLICKNSGCAIEAVTSGQDGVEAAKIAKDMQLLYEMEEKYPGLFDILRDPYESLYLHEGMYELALRFLEDYVGKNGKQQIQFLYAEDSLEMYLVRSALEQLVSVSGSQREYDVLDVLFSVGCTYEEPGWDPYFLNEAMIEMLKKECATKAELIENYDIYKLHEENKQFFNYSADMGIELVYASIMLWDKAPRQSKEYWQNVELEGEVKLNETENNTNNNTGGEGTGTFEPPKITVNSKGELTNGQYTLNEADMQIHIDGKNPLKSQFLYDVDAGKAVLDAAAYADENNLWEAGSGNPADFANKAKVYVENGPVGVTGKGELTDYINVYRTKTGYIHGCPGNP